MNSCVNSGTLASSAAFGRGLEPTYKADTSLSKLVIQPQDSYLSYLGFPMQGSILGPLLLINDHPDRLLVSNILPFADDAKCFMPISSSSDCPTLQSDLSSLVDWSTTWKLTFNENKWCVIHNISNTTLSYSINNTGIALVDTQKDLGVVLSSDIQWRSHYLKPGLQNAWSNMLSFFRS